VFFWEGEEKNKMVLTVNIELFESSTTVSFEETVSVAVNFSFSFHIKFWNENILACIENDCR